MNKRIHISKSSYLDIELTLSQLFAIIFMFMIMFALPVYIYNRAQTPVQSVSAEADETYTAAALRESQGEVAGVSTGPDGSNFINIPILNLSFDTTFNDPASLPILFGGVVGGISLLLFGTLFVDLIRR
ncbi:MAG: hypothetical protein ACE5DX_04180 [Candidatus Dojkabacteria bacterium]